MNTDNQLSNVNKPSYLANVPPPPPGTIHAPWGMESFSKPPRIFVVQALSKAPLKPPFKDGDIVVSGAGKFIKIGDFETPYSFTPVLFFVDYLALNPNSVQPFIRERSFDPASTIAKKAKAFTREQLPGGASDQVIKYVTNLNFIVIVHHEEIGEIPVHQSFNRGTYKIGQSLIGLIQDRRDTRHIPMCHRYQAISRMIPGKGTTTFPAPDIKNDPIPFVVDEEEFKRYQKLSKDLEELVLAGTLETDIDPLDASEGDASSEKKF